MLKFVKIITASLLIISASNTSVGQELNCDVQINSSQIAGSDKSIFDAMQQVIFSFVNNRKWTKHSYKNEERIECSILINITERISTNQFKGTFQVQSRRPVFNSSYNSTLLNHVDKEFEFTFNEFDPLDYSETTHLSNITSVLSFYVFIILGLDYDSFEMNGGTPYFQQAQIIVNNAQSAREAGWKAFENTSNRYWLVTNFLHPSYVSLRECWYNYHRLGFDVMAKELVPGRAKVLKSLTLLEKAYDINPNSFQLQVFFNAKSDEIVSLFKKATSREKTEVYNLLSKINPINVIKYERILKGK